MDIFIKSWKGGLYTKQTEQLYKVKKKKKNHRFSLQPPTYIKFMINICPHKEWFFFQE